MQAELTTMVVASRLRTNSRVLQLPSTVFQVGNRSLSYVVVSTQAETVRDASWDLAVSAEGMPGWDVLVRVLVVWLKEKYGQQWGRPRR